jgi:hypothetical protein
VPTDQFVPTLISELRARLSELENERLAITRALRVLEPMPSRRRTRSLDKRLLEQLRASPGSRASLLALEFGMDVAVVTAALGGLEKDGEAARAGMGWEVTGAGMRRT